MTTSNSLVHKMRIVKRFHFHHTKAIAHRQSAILTSFLEMHTRGRMNAISAMTITGIVALVS